MKDTQELKPSEIVKKYGFSSLNEVSRQSEISAKTLINWSRTKDHERRFHLVLKGLIVEKFSEWVFSKATLLRKDQDPKRGLFATDPTIDKLVDFLQKQMDEVDK